MRTDLALLMEVPECRSTTRPTCAAHGAHYSEKPPAETAEIMLFFTYAQQKNWRDGLFEAFPKPEVVEILMEVDTPSLLCFLNTKYPLKVTDLKPRQTIS